MSVLGERLKKVIVISVKTKSGNFEEHCVGLSCLFQNGS